MGTIKISKFGSEVGDSLSKEKPEPGWKKIWKLLSSERWQSERDEQVEFLVYATSKLICPEEPRESLRRDLEEVRKRFEAEKDEGKRQMIVEHQLGFLVSFIQMDRKTLECFIERKEQKDELQILRSKLRAQEQEIERKEEDERLSQLERKRREQQELREKEERENDYRIQVERLEEKLDLAKQELRGKEERENDHRIQVERLEEELDLAKEERKLCEDKTKIMSSLVEGLMQLRVKAIREVGEGKLRTSKQEPPTSTKPHLVALTPYPIPVLQICSLNPNSSVPPRPLTISSFHPLLILTSLLSLHEFLRLAIPNPFLEMSTGMRPPPEPPPLL